MELDRIQPTEGSYRYELTTREEMEAYAAAMREDIAHRLSQGLEPTEQLVLTEAKLTAALSSSKTKTYKGSIANAKTADALSGVLQRFHDSTGAVVAKLANDPEVFLDITPALTRRHLGDIAGGLAMQFSTQIELDQLEVGTEPQT